jgi:hypothetical protein
LCELSAATIKTDLLVSFEKKDVYHNLTPTALKFTLKLLHDGTISFQMPCYKKESEQRVLQLLDAVSDQCEDLRRFSALPLAEGGRARFPKQIILRSLRCLPEIQVLRIPTKKFSNTDLRIIAAELPMLV